MELACTIQIWRPQPSAAVHRQLSTPRYAPLAAVQGYEAMSRDVEGQPNATFKHEMR
jgi:hypothetical protein